MSGSLLRYTNNGVELPAPGIWMVPASHATIEFTERRWLQRDRRHTRRARESVIVMSDHPGDAAVTVSLDGLKLVVHADSGPQPWMLSGQLIDGDEIRPVRARLSYHGVWRRGDRAHGWFVLTGEVGERGSGRPLHFRFELLALAPSAASTRRSVA
jgi:hypothetical protein